MRLRSCNGIACILHLDIMAACQAVLELQARQRTLACPIGRVVLLDSGWGESCVGIVPFKLLYVSKIVLYSTCMHSVNHGTGIASAHVTASAIATTPALLRSLAQVRSCRAASQLRTCADVSPLLLRKLCASLPHAVRSHHSTVWTPFNRGVITCCTQRKLASQHS